MFVACLVCVSILAASVDRLPDPPAIEHRAISAQTLSVVPSVPDIFPYRSASVVPAMDLRASAGFPASEFCDIICPADGLTMMRQAADPSPPMA